MNIITYSLKHDNRNSDEYYKGISVFTDLILSEAEVKLARFADKYIDYLDKNKKEKLRTRIEYLYELIMLGVLWNIYVSDAKSLNPIPGEVLSQMAKLRRKYRNIKPAIDNIRGKMATLFLVKRRINNGLRYKTRRKYFDKLLLWMEASGEFKEEVKRFALWKDYFDTLPENSFKEILIFASLFGRWFEEESEDYLGNYTENIDEFLKNCAEDHKWKEDYIFCRRKRVEYHLIMVGAEVMNRAFGNDFKKTERKAVLAPACMRIKSALECKAVQVGLDLKCTNCAPACRINQLTKLGEKMNFEVRIIPHSSDFTAWLEKFAAGKGIGVIGVACILNLIQGGLELKGLEIPAQCVLLDYCGCNNHWDEEGFPTELNINHLKSFLEN